MIKVTRIGVNSAFKVGAVVYALFWAVFGLFFVVFQGAITSLFFIGMGSSNSASFSSSGMSGGDLGIFSAISIGSLICFYAVGVVIAGLSGGISAALMAMFYNFTVRLVGGLEIEMAGNPAYATRGGTLLDEIEEDLSGKAKRY
ncbi:MAG: DUF3566 domain-containing protein [Anaerolineae bacterium]|nr:DUF3566 domain-containing protein [Anaerolineae bacterium]